MPLHTGHLNLISYGLTHCKHITLLLVISESDPIEPKLRYSWLFENYKENSKISIKIIDRKSIDLLPQKDRTAAWCRLIKSDFPTLDTIISSESYGDLLADFLGVKHLKFDHKREITPISASEIRDNYEKHMDYLPEHVRSFFSS